MFRSRRVPKSGGLSLVETTFAGFIISLTVIFLANLIPTTFLAMKQSETRTQANLLAQSLLEEMRTIPFSQLQPLPPASVTNDNVSYEYETFVENLSDADAAFLKRVRVEVVWKVRSEQKRISLETYVHAVHR